MFVTPRTQLHHCSQLTLEYVTSLEISVMRLFLLGSFVWWVKLQNYVWLYFPSRFRLLPLRTPSPFLVLGAFNLRSIVVDATVEHQPRPAATGWGANSASSQVQNYAGSCQYYCIGINIFYLCFPAFLCTELTLKSSHQGTWGKVTSSILFWLSTIGKDSLSRSRKGLSLVSSKMQRWGEIIVT